MIKSKMAPMVAATVGIDLLLGGASLIAIALEARKASNNQSDK